MARGKKYNDVPEVNLFSARFRGLMDHAFPRLSQEELGKRLGLSKSSIAFYRDGRSQPDYANLVKIAKFSGGTTDYLLGLTDVKGYDSSLRSASDYTGLSEQCLKEIRRLLNDRIDQRADRKIGLTGLIDSVYAPELLEQPQSVYWKVADLVAEAEDIDRFLGEMNTKSILESKKRLQEIVQLIDFYFYRCGEVWQLFIKEHIAYDLLIKEVSDIQDKVDSLITNSKQSF